MKRLLVNIQFTSDEPEQYFVSGTESVSDIIQYLHREHETPIIDLQTNEYWLTSGNKRLLNTESLAAQIVSNSACLRLWCQPKRIAGPFAEDYTQTTQTEAEQKNTIPHTKSPDEHEKKSSQPIPGFRVNHKLRS